MTAAGADAADDNDDGDGADDDDDDDEAGNVRFHGHTDGDGARMNTILQRTGGEGDNNDDHDDDADVDDDDDGDDDDDDVGATANTSGLHQPCSRPNFLYTVDGLMQPLSAQSSQEALSRWGRCSRCNVTVGLKQSSQR